MRVEAATAKLDGLAPVTEDRLSFADEPPDLRKTDSRDNLLPSCNAAYVDAELLDDVLVWPEMPISIYGDRVVNDAAGLVRKGGWLEEGSDSVRTPAYPDLVEKTLDRFLQLRYLFVVRRHEYVEPKVIEDPALDRFHGGYFRGDVVVLDLDTGDVVGGFAVAAGSRETVEVRNVDMSGDLASSLALGVYRAVEDRIRDLAPEVVLASD